MQLFMSKLTEHKSIEWHRNDVHTDCIKDLFLACPSTIELLQAFPQVLIIDCTNKTNRHDMSLLEIVDVTLTDLTFLVCFANLESERENNYIWAFEETKKYNGREYVTNVYCERKRTNFNESYSKKNFEAQLPFLADDIYQEMY